MTWTTPCPVWGQIDQRPSQCVAFIFLSHFLEDRAEVKSIDFGVRSVIEFRLHNFAV